MWSPSSRKAPHALLVLWALLPAAQSCAAELAVHMKRANGTALPETVISLEPVGSAAPARSTKASVDQINMEFVPLVSAAQVGASMDFPNSDHTRHQVYSFSPAKTFNLKLYANKPAAPILLDQAGTVVLGCNIHDTMVAWIRVVPTPWFAVTDNNGNARIADVPKGDYTLKIWHPSMMMEPKGEPLSLKDDTTRIERSMQAATVDELRKALKNAAGGFGANP